LLEDGTDVDATIPDGRTAASIALRKDNKKVIQRLQKPKKQL
jgi:hypothetical protein